MCKLFPCCHCSHPNICKYGMQQNQMICSLLQTSDRFPAFVLCFLRSPIRLLPSHIHAELLLASVSSCLRMAVYKLSPWNCWGLFICHQAKTLHLMLSAESGAPCPKQALRLTLLG